MAGRSPIPLLVLPKRRSTERDELTLSGQTAIGAIRQPGARKTIFSFVVHRADGGWTCASAHNTDAVPNMETNVIGEDGAFRAANYRTGQVS